METSVGASLSSSYRVPPDWQNSEPISGFSTPSQLSVSAMASPIPLSSTPQQVSTQQTRSGRAELLKDSVICRVSSLAEAQAAQDAGVGAIIVSGSTTDFAPSATLISSLTKSSPLPLVGQCRPGHFAEAQLLQSAGCDFIDEAEELDTVDVRHHIHKHTLKPVCISGAADLGGALRRISEGAAMVRTYGSDLANTVQSLRAIMSGVRRAHNLDDSELHAFAQELQAPFHILKEVARTKRLPVPLFAV